jgi:hypothetical protein
VKKNFEFIENKPLGYKSYLASSIQSELAGFPLASRR